MIHVQGPAISILYSEDSDVLYAYTEEGPVFAYANNSMEIYPADFRGNFHEKVSGTVYYDRNINVISYYNGKKIKIGEMDAFPELILDATQNDSPSGLLYQLESNEMNEVVEILKDRQKCKVIGSSFSYFSCCQIDPAESASKAGSVEGYVYLPFDVNQSRWRKIKDGSRLNQEIFDQSCQALYEHDYHLDEETSKKLSVHFFNSDIVKFKEELRSAVNNLIN